MPFHYEIETDALYLEGIEKGIEKGAEQATQAARINTVKKMLLQKKYAVQDIMYIAEVDEAFVRKIALEIGVEL
jgi:hypothetical protein